MEPLEQSFSPASEEQKPSPLAGCFRFIVDIVETILISLVLFLGINAVTARVRVDGHSMAPTFNSGEFIIVSKLAYKFGEPQRGDVVVFHLPRDPSQDYIKRVIGLPGETVDIRDGTVFVDSQPLEEPYLDDKTRYTGTWFVPEGTLFVLGDNRNNSSDSHSWGPVPMEYIIGKAVFVYWPLASLGLVDQPTPVLASP